MRFIRCLVGALLVLGLQACSVNPVTGQQELALISTEEEVSIGEKNYVPGRQSQGGDYVADPQLLAYVKRVGAKLAAKSDRPLPYEFSIINNATPNAWALPGGKIAINRGLLLELDSEAELAAVLGHEIVHAAARHGAKAMQRGLLLQTAVFAVAIASRDDSSAGLKVLGSQVGAMLLSQTYSRDAELESDHYGMEIMARAGYQPEAAVTLQQTFVRLSEGKQSNWLAGLFASHPPSQERVERNRATAKKLGQKGQYFREEYLRATAHLRAVKPAYDAYQKGIEAMTSKNWPEVELQALRAIRLEPQEGLFYSLLAQYYEHEKRLEQAVAQLNMAIEKSPQYFLFYLQRGQIHKALGNRAQAKSDLEKSQRLLPTELAQQLLKSL